MKKNTLILAAATVIILFFFAGCDKYHRDRYTGTWEFVTNKRVTAYENSYPVARELDTTIYYTGKISYGNFENQVIIIYTENDEVTFPIDKHGRFAGYLRDGDGNYGDFGGRIDFEGNKKVNFDISWFYWDENGSQKGRADSVKGTKIKKGGKNE